MHSFDTGISLVKKRDNWALLDKFLKVPPALQRRLRFPAPPSVRQVTRVECYDYLPHVCWPQSRTSFWVAVCGKRLLRVRRPATFCVGRKNQAADCGAAWCAQKKRLTGLAVSKAEMDDMMNADEEAAAVVVERLHRVLVKGGMVPDDHRCVPEGHAVPAGAASNAYLRRLRVNVSSARVSGCASAQAGCAAVRLSHAVR